MRDFTELDRQIDNAETHALDEDAPGRKWFQGSWVAPCGTYGCIAGNTLLDHGFTASNVDSLTREVYDNGRLGVSFEAEKILGLDDEEAGAIFASGNTIGVLRRLQKDLQNGHKITYEDAWRYRREELQANPEVARSE